MRRRPVVLVVLAMMMVMVIVYVMVMLVTVTIAIRVGVLVDYSLMIVFVIVRDSTLRFSVNRMPGSTMLVLPMLKFILRDSTLRFSMNRMPSSTTLGMPMPEILIFTSTIGVASGLRVAVIERMAQCFVGLFDLVHLALVLQDTTAFLSSQLFLALFLLPSCFLSARMEVRLDLVLLMIQLKLFIAHVGMFNSKIFKAQIRITLFIVNVTFLHK